MQPFFRSPDLQEQFLRDGYVVIPFLDPGGAAELREWFFELYDPLPEEGFYASTFHPDLAFKQSIFERVDGLCAEKVAADFVDVKKLGASFLMKKTWASGEKCLSIRIGRFTDEDQTFTATVWVPLQDVTAENGAIKVLPGSHRFTNAFRSPTLPIVYKDVYHLLEEHLVTLNMKAGEGFIFHHNLLHSSHINQSTEPRIAITYGLAPAYSPLCYYHHHAEDPPYRFEKINVPDDFFTRYYQTGKRPDFGISAGFFQQDLSPFSEAECRSLLSGERKEIRRELYREVGTPKDSGTSPGADSVKAVPGKKGMPTRDVPGSPPEFQMLKSPLPSLIDQVNSKKEWQRQSSTSGLPDHNFRSGPKSLSR